MNRFLLTLPLAAALAACGGGGKPIGVESSSGAAGFERINDILVPPEPDQAENNRTIEGIDLDKNGVRDDIDRWAAKSFGHVPAVVHPVYMLMRAEQDLLVLRPNSTDEAVRVFRNAIDYGVCGAYVIEENGLDFGRIADELHLRTVNTKERIARLKELRTLAGSFSSTVGSVHKDCNHPQK